MQPVHPINGRSLPVGATAVFAPISDIPTLPQCAEGACYHLDMEFKQLPGSNSSEPVRPTESDFGEWLTVSEATAFCSMRGLARTPKTLRKWAMRSHRDLDSSDLTVRREDIDNGWRWTIERSSLERKIEQELEFEARRLKGLSETAELVRPGPNPTEPVHTGALLNYSDETSDVAIEPGRTRSDRFDQIPKDDSAKRDEDPEANQSGKVCAGALGPTANRDQEHTQLLARIEDLKTEVEFLRDELMDRRQTTLALTDVIEAFRLSAASNASRAQDRSERGAHDIQTSDHGDGR